MQIYKIELLTPMGWLEVARTNDPNECRSWLEKYRNDGHEVRYIGKHYN